MLVHGGSRLRLFGDEAGDIGRDAITAALLQQQKRVNRTAEKAAAHHREDNLAEWRVDNILVQGVQPRLV